MNFLGRTDRPRTLSGDLTPLVDVVFLLIVFFLTTSSLVEITREPVTLPEQEGERESDARTPGIVVNVTVTGGLIVEREPVTRAQLAEMLRVEVARAGGDPRAVDVLIRCDQDAPLEHLNQLARTFTAIGIRSWRLGTSVPSGGSAS
ncbi:MAG: biopolymer transporter ExbD [Planctomycetota bacterium]